MRRLVVAGFVAAVPVLLATPASAEDLVDLRLSASFDQSDYGQGETVVLRLVVENLGAAPASEVVLSMPTTVDFGSPGALDSDGPGTSLAPGEQVVLTLTAPVPEVGTEISTIPQVLSRLADDRDPADNTARLAATITRPPGDLAVTVYEDRDGDATPDPGEPRAGVAVTVFALGRVFETRTGQDGVATFTGLPAADYGITVAMRSGWFADGALEIPVRSGQASAVAVRGLHVDLSGLTATVSLDRDQYAPGDAVRERVTLTNNGRTTLTSLYAHCGHYGTDNVLYSTGWGELAPSDGSGVTLRPGETRSWEFTDTVPLLAWDYGFVSLSCEFMHPSGLSGAVAEARARVPGGYGSASGVLMHGTSPVPSATVVLVDSRGAVAARAVSDPAGRFDLGQVAADGYELRVLGPWRSANSSHSWIQVMAGQAYEVNPFELVPGPTLQDPELQPVRMHAPVPVSVPAEVRADVPDRLADTGASVRELTVVGALFLVAGLVLVRPRRVAR